MYKVFIVLFVFFLFEQAHAGDYNFETNAEGIINALTRQRAEQKIKTRNLKGINGPKPRGMRIVQIEDGKIVEKTIMVSENNSIKGVNLKIEFDFDSYTIRTESFSLLDELGKALTSEKIRGDGIVIKGHTDSDGDATYNLELSLKRALAAKLYLTDHFSISPSLLKIAGYGEAMPLVSNTSETNKQINRRVEISLAARP